MIRVLHLTRDFPPRHHGGISAAVAGLARATASTGHVVSVVSFDDWRPRRRGCATGPPATARQEDGMPVLRLSTPAQLGAVDAFAAAQRPDILHVHDALLWPVAAALRQQLGAPAVITMHVVQRAQNALRGSTEQTLGLEGEEAAVAGADRIVVPSRAAAAALAGGEWPWQARLRVVPHGIADTVAARAQVARRAAEGASTEAPTFLAVGRFDDVKGTPELFTAIPRLLQRLPTAAFVVVGGIPANRRAEARWRAQWERSAPADVRARVRFTGWLAPGAVVPHYEAASALVVASRFETFGLVALEAMLHGVPVVATAAGGLGEIITHGESGLLSPVTDVPALVDNVVRVAHDRALARRIGGAGAAAVRRRWLWPQVLPQLVAVYRELR